LVVDPFAGAVDAGFAGLVVAGSAFLVVLGVWSLAGVSLAGVPGELSEEEAPFQRAGPGIATFAGSKWDNT
jgi:hypothetical protein